MELVLNMNLIIMTPISINLFIFIFLDLIKINKHFEYYDFMIFPLLNTHLRDFYPKIY